MIDEPKGRRGGMVRAEKLSPAERREIAQKAAAARWSEKMPTAAFGSNDRPLKVGDLEIPCYVLDDGRRVIVQRGMMTALDMSQGTAGRGGGDRLAKFVATKSISSFVGTQLQELINSPILFKVPNGSTAYGYEATVLADLCEAVLSARKEGLLHYQQAHIAERCEILVRAFAKVGIVALVDEATGYQGVRPQDALQRYLEMVLRKELAAWAKRFPDEFYENIYKLRGWHWPGMKVNRYSVVAKYTRDLVYDRLAPSLLEELEKKNPKTASGARKARFHQWLTDDVGHPLLAQHLHSLIMFQRLAIANGYGWNRFVKMVDAVMPKKGDTMELPLTHPEGP